MKKILSFLILAIFSLLTVQAQDEDVMFPYRYIDEGDELYVYATVANVRNGIGTSASVVDKLSCGDVIKVTELTEEGFSQSGLYGRWIGISYTKNGTRKNGYVWEGVLSPTQIRRGNVKFIYGMESGNMEEYECKLGLKVVVGTKLASTQYVTTGVRGFIYTEVSEDGKGLYGVERIVTLVTAGEACGVSSHYYNFAWDGTSLIPLVHCMVVGDADYSYDSIDVIYPEQGAPHNTIIKIENGGVNENGSDEENQYSSYEEMYYKLSIYKWDGKSVKLQKQGTLN